MDTRDIVVTKPGLSAICGLLPEPDPPGRLETYDSPHWNRNSLPDWQNRLLFSRTSLTSSLRHETASFVVLPETDKSGPADKQTTSQCRLNGRAPTTPTCRMESAREALIPRCHLPRPALFTAAAVSLCL